MMKINIKTTLSVTACAFFSLGANAKNSCLVESEYSTQLTVPSLERWAEGSYEAEKKMANDLQRYFISLQKGFSKHPASKGKLLRGTHSKGVCFSGSFESKVSAQLSDKKKAILQDAGLFQSTEKLDTMFRFANAASFDDADWIKDIRALSMRVKMGDKEQHFAFNNVSHFQLATLKEFKQVLTFGSAMKKYKASLGESKAAGGLSLLLIAHEGAIRKAMQMAGYNADTYNMLNLINVRKNAENDKDWHKSYADQTYWSTASFAVTQDTSAQNKIDRVVRFGAKPCSDAKAATLENELAAKNYAESLWRSGKVENARNYLGESMQSDVAEKAQCFNLFVQFLDEEEKYVEDRKNGLYERAKAYASDLVENPTLKWSAPTHVVGQLMVEKSMTAEECDAPENAINVVKKTDGIVGIGQMNRARYLPEEASQQCRAIQ